jgi:ribosomal protein S18 acetylase RimI-like enzyme
VGQPTIEIEVYEQLPERRAIPMWSVARGCFPHPADETDEQRHENEDRFCSDDDVVRYVLALDVGDVDEVVGLTLAYRRVVQLAGRSVVLGGLGRVAVRPNHRRQGIATRLTRRAIQELASVGCDVAYLCTDVHDPGMLELYGRTGFVPLGRPHTYLGASGRRYVDDDGMIAPVGSREVFEEILRQAEPFDIGQGNW